MKTSLDQNQEYLAEVDLSQIVVNPFQPRRRFATEELEELALSIKAVGIIHPPVVRPQEESTPSALQIYELIAGERRFRAAQIAGLKRIPVIIRKSTDGMSAQAALIENLQRVDLNPLDIAQSMKQLMLDLGLTQEDLAKRVGKKRSTVANYVRILNLPKTIQESVSAGLISLGHAKAILALEDEKKQCLLHEIILRDNLTVRDAEKTALRLLESTRKQPKSKPTSRDFHLDLLAEKLQHKIGTKVSIQGKGKQGRISIDYYNLDDLDHLLKIFGIEEI